MTADSQMTAFCVGLTGGIGSGKSAVSARLTALGALVIDTDEVSRELTGENGRAIASIREAFGQRALTPGGAMDRGYVRQRVFGDAHEKKRLESILHPMIRDEVESRIAKATGPYVVLVVPLLVETEYYRLRCQSIVTVTCPLDVRVARVMGRSGLTRAEVLSIVATQATDDQRLAVADELIENAGTLEELSLAVEALHGRLLKCARAVAQE